MITLHKQWTIRAPIDRVASILTDFEHLPKYFPKVAEAVAIQRKVGDTLEMEATVRSFGRKFKVRMHTRILPGRGFISDNDSYQFGTSGHEELLLSVCPEGTFIDYTYQVQVHKWWLRILATPLIRWYAMRAWEKTVIDELRKLLEQRTELGTDLMDNAWEKLNIATDKKTAFLEYCEVCIQAKEQGGLREEQAAYRICSAVQFDDLNDGATFEALIDCACEMETPREMSVGTGIGIGETWTETAAATYKATQWKKFMSLYKKAKE